MPIPKLRVVQTPCQRLNGFQEGTRLLQVLAETPFTSATGADNLTIGSSQKTEGRLPSGKLITDLLA